MCHLHFKKAAVLSAVSLVLALMMPISAVEAVEISNGLEVRNGEAQEIELENVYLAGDVFLRDPATKNYKKQLIEKSDMSTAPSSLLTNSKYTATKKASGKEAASGGGAGGWYPLNPAYAPSTDPDVDYDFSLGDYGNAVDRNGVQHSFYYADTKTNIRQAPDPGPGTIDALLTDIFYTSYKNGTWSTPVSIAATSGFEDCELVMWDFDDDDYLHFVYTKWTWGRSSAYPGANPPPAAAYIHKNENVFYRCMAPDGTWSAPRQITNLPAGAWAVSGCYFDLVQNRIYGTVAAEFNKETAIPSYTARYLFAEGSFEDWESLHNLKEWDYVSAAGNEVAVFAPMFGVNRVNSEAAVIFSTMLLGADAYSTSTRVYGAVKSGSGSWSPVTTVISGSNNESWVFPFVRYRSSSTVAMCIGFKDMFGIDATHEPGSNIFTIDHESSGWKTPVNVTRIPARQTLGNISLHIDIMGFLNVVFSGVYKSWDGANWNDTGDSIHYTREQKSGLSEVSTVSAYAANRRAIDFEAEIDVNGYAHVIFVTDDLATGLNSRLYYTDNSSGSWITPTQLSANNGQSIGYSCLSVGPEIRTIASWAEIKVSAAGVPEIGRINSMTYRNGSWSSRKSITTVPGSSDIVHVVAAVWPFYSYIEEGNQGDQICIFETAKYNTGTATWYDFRKYYCESINGVWSEPETVSNLNASGEGSVFLDRNNIARAIWGITDTATNKYVLYCTTQKQPTPSASTYYFAEGTTREGFQEWLSLQNAGDAEADVKITYMLGTGENKEQEVKVPAHSRVTVDVNGFVGPGQDVSASVVSDRLIVAERPMYFNYQGSIPGGHVGMGSTTTSRVLFFAEGTTRQGFNEYLTLQNPSNTDTEVTITYMFGDGTTKDQKVRVNKKTRQTVDVNAFVGIEKDFSIKIVSPDIAIAAERPIYFNYHSILQGGHNAVASSSLDSRWYFAEGTTRPGFDTYLCLQNPGPADATAGVTYIMGDGSTMEQTVNLPSTSRQTVNVRDITGSDKDVSMVVDSNTLILAERPMYFDYHGVAGGGHNVMGGHEPKNAWYLAEGTTRTGFDEWICLENSSEQDGAAVLSYMLGDGSVVNQNVAVPAHTRVTVDVRLAIGNDKDVSAYVWCDKGIIAERPMYFTNGDRRWNGGSCVMGF